MQMSDTGSTSGGMKNVSVLWYGERGVVNSLVIAIHAGGVSAVSDLLRQVQWADKSQPAWLSDIASVSMIVEPGCSQFGDPDLILVLTTNDSQRYVVYFEAKVVTYAASAVPNSKGMKEKKFNSAINGQLSLRYRMSLALAQWNGTANLVEPTTIYNQYLRRSEDGGINEKLSKPRHLLKRSVLKLLRDAGVHGVPSEHFYFLSVTSDHQLDLSAMMSSDVLPLFLDHQGNNIWNQIAPRVGWLGFASIDLSPLNELLATSYRQALGTMVEPAPQLSISSPAQRNAGTATMNSINSYNIDDKSSAATKSQLTALEAAAIALTDAWKVTRGPGSTSVIYSGKTIAKFVPQGFQTSEFLMLGISTLFERSAWNGDTLIGPELFGRGDQQQPFYWLELPTDSTGVDIAEGILAELATACGAEVEAD